MIFEINNKLKKLGVLLLFCYRASANPPAQTVPDFTFYTLNKTVFTSKNLEQGKFLFFIFFDPGCEHCQRAVISLNDHYKQFKNTAIYLVSTSNAETINQFINSFGKGLYNKKNVVLLQDRHNVFVDKFQPRRYPGMFLYSAERKLIDYEDNEDTMFRFWKDINS